MDGRSLASYAALYIDDDNTRAMSRGAPVEMIDSNIDSMLH